jgi:hypothetical protein
LSQTAIGERNQQRPSTELVSIGSETHTALGYAKEDDRENADDTPSAAAAR